MKNYAKITLGFFISSSLLLLFVTFSELSNLSTDFAKEKPVIAKVKFLMDTHLRFRLVEHAVWQSARMGQDILNNTIFNYVGNKNAELKLIGQKIQLSFIKKSKIILFLDPYCDDIGPDGILLKIVNGTIVLKSLSTTWVLDEKNNYCIHPNGPQPI